ncbi:DBH-like monooxygenase protein 1 [Lobulomyces angularis]|nr:DBH-like monooxygenase protein 1 [Lobulomyces angularis]
MKQILYFIILFTAITSSVQNIKFQPDFFEHHEILITPSKKEINLHWKVNAIDEIIEFGISAHVNGWLALGLSDSGGMTGADIFLGRKVNGEFLLEDRFALETGYPKLDKSQDLNLISSFHENGELNFHFTRKLKTCDTEDSVIRLDIPLWFIFAFGEGDFGKHLPGNNAQKLIDLSGKYFEKELIGENLKEETFNLPLIAPKIELLPFDTVEDYVIKSPLVHHFVGYLCDAPPKDLKEGESKCNILGKNSVINFDNKCSKFYLVWAKGGTKRMYPSIAGKPIGKGELNTKYLVMETHYANPELLSGMVDEGSGFNLTVTKQLREKDVGMFTLGVDTEFIAIPPKSKESTLVSDCGEKCMNKIDAGFPESGLNVIAMLLHMHRRYKNLSLIVYNCFLCYFTFKLILIIFKLIKRHQDGN